MNKNMAQVQQSCESGREPVDEVALDQRVVAYWSEPIARERASAEQEPHIHLYGHSNHTTDFREVIIENSNGFGALLILLQGGNVRNNFIEERQHKCSDCVNIPAGPRCSFTAGVRVLPAQIELLEQICLFFKDQEETTTNEQLSGLVDRLLKNCQKSRTTEKMTACMTAQFTHLFTRMRFNTQLNVFAQLSHFEAFTSLKAHYRDGMIRYYASETASVIGNVHSKIEKILASAKHDNLRWEEVEIISCLHKHLLSNSTDVAIQEELQCMTWGYQEPMSGPSFGHPKTIEQKCCVVIKRIICLAKTVALESTTTEKHEWENIMTTVNSTDGFLFARNLSDLARNFAEHAAVHSTLHARLFINEHCERNLPIPDGVVIFRNKQTEVIKSLAPIPKYWGVWSDQKRHLHIISGISALYKENQTLKEQFRNVTVDLDTTTQAHATADSLYKSIKSKNDTANHIIIRHEKKIARLQHDLEEKRRNLEFTHKDYEQRASKCRTEIASITSRLGLKEQELHKQKIEVDNVKSTWSKRLQSQYDKVAELEIGLREERALHSSARVELAKEQQKMRTARDNWIKNLEKYNTMKDENERLKGLEHRVNTSSTQQKISTSSQDAPPERQDENDMGKARIQELKSSIDNKDELLAAQQITAQENLAMKAEIVALKAKLLNLDARPGEKRNKRETQDPALIRTYQQALLDKQEELATQKELVKTLAQDVTELKLENAKLDAKLAAEVATTLEYKIKMESLEADQNASSYQLTRLHAGNEWQEALQGRTTWPKNEEYSADGLNDSEISHDIRQPKSMLKEEEERYTVIDKCKLINDLQEEVIKLKARNLELEGKIAAGKEFMKHWM